MDSSPRCLPLEAVYGFAVIALTGLCDGLGPVGMMQRIRIKLGFQSDAGIFSVVDAVLALLVQIVAGIELNAGTVGVDCHAAPGDGI